MVKEEWNPNFVTIWFVIDGRSADEKVVDLYFTTGEYSNMAEIFSVIIL
jgi:hypothetical protein